MSNGEAVVNSTNRTWSGDGERDVDIDYPSLEAVEAPVQLGLITLFSLTACLSLSGNLTVIAVLSLGKRYTVLRSNIKFCLIISCKKNELYRVVLL